MLCCEVHYIWLRNKYLELQELENSIKSNETIILAIIRFVPNNNPRKYKEHFILFNAFAFGEVVTIIYWLSNMNIYVSDLEELYKDTIIGHLEN